MNNLARWLFLGVTLCSSSTYAGGKSPSHGGTKPPSTTKPEPPAKEPSPSSYKYVVDKDGTYEEMRIEGIGTKGVDGYIDYEVVPGTDFVSIHGVKGVKDIKGIGEALKKELLRRHPAHAIKSQLVDVNRTKLLEAWAQGHHGEDLRVVPALKFEGFDYTITAEASKTGHSGSVFLEMKPTEGKGSITVTNPDELDAIVKASPRR